MRKVFLAVLTIMLATVSVLGQGQAPTLRVETEDPNLPSKLFYGNVEVKPLRLRPGTNVPIVIDDPDFFVSEHYIDFLSRFADQGGLDYWTAQTTGTCASNDARCILGRRVSVSAAFFIELEFQQTGGYVYNMYRSTLGRAPNYNEFRTDRRQVVGGAQLPASKVSFANAWVNRADFVQKYPASLDGPGFVDALIATVNQTSGVNLSGQRNSLISDFNTGGRALVVRKVAEDPAFATATYTQSFVAMQYWGYLGRDYDQGGYDFWVNVLSSREPGNYRGMVCSFITSREYQERKGSPVTRTNQDCANLPPQ